MPIKFRFSIAQATPVVPEPQVKSKTVSGSLYISPHMLGAAIDFDAKGMTAEETRNKIIQSQDLLPCPIRLESGTNWVHIDVYDSLGSSKKVTMF